MYKKNITDPLKNIASSFQRLQKQLENPCRLPEVVPNSSVSKYLNRQIQIENSVLKYLNQQIQIENSVKFPEIITNSPFVKMEKMNKQFTELFKVPKVASELSTKSILPTLPNINFPNIIVPRPFDNSIFPFVPEERHTPSPETDSTTIFDEVYDERIPSEQHSVPFPDIDRTKISYKVLIVGGFFDDTNQIVARFIEQLGIEAIILSEQPNGGRTRLEKFKAYTNVDFAIILLTPDDVGRAKDNPYDELKHRPSQDTIFGLGYLCNHLRPEQMCTLYTEKIELPSLLEGYIHFSICSSDSWKLKLIKEMQCAGLRIDGNKL